MEKKSLSMMNLHYVALLDIVATLFYAVVKGWPTSIGIAYEQRQEFRICGGSCLNKQLKYSGFKPFRK